MRLALIGAGRIGPLHARTLTSLESVDEVVIHDLVAERAQRAAAGFGASVAASLDEALEGADGVLVTASTDAHGALVRAALERGLPTFCEKPLAATLEASIELAAVVERSGVPFQLGFQRRFDPAYRAARALVESGDLGALYLLALQSHDPAPASEAFIATSGGMFRDLSIHDLDVLRFLTGSEVAEVFAMGSVREFPVYARHDDFETSAATLRLADGVLVLLGATRHDPLGHDVRAELFGSQDSVSVGLGPRMPLRSLEPGVPAPTGPAWQIFLDRWDDAYHAEMVEFGRLVRGEVASPCTARDGVEALRIAEALTISARVQRLVSLSEIAG